VKFAPPYKSFILPVSRPPCPCPVVALSLSVPASSCLPHPPCPILTPHRPHRVHHSFVLRSVPWPPRLCLFKVMVLVVVLFPLSLSRHFVLLSHPRLPILPSSGVSLRTPSSRPLFSSLAPFSSLWGRPVHPSRPCPLLPPHPHSPFYLSVLRQLCLPVFLTYSLSPSCAADMLYDACKQRVVRIYHTQSCGEGACKVRFRSTLGSF
jgi:hypothetical protein